MSVTRTAAATTAGAAAGRPQGPTPAQREALQKFTVMRNSLDDRGDLFGGAAIQAMLLQELVGHMGRAADELGSLAQKPTPAFPTLADVQTYVAGHLAPVDDALARQQAAIDSLSSGAATTAAEMAQVQHGLAQASRQDHEAIETLTHHLSRTDQAVAAVREQIERLEGHLSRHDREREALRQRLDTVAQDVGRFVAEVDWALLRSVATLEERVRRLEPAEPHAPPAARQRRS